MNKVYLFNPDFKKQELKLDEIASNMEELALNRPLMEGIREVLKEADKKGELAVILLASCKEEALYKANIITRSYLAAQG